MLVSIIIPVHNAENFIDETIKSVISQSYANIEILCINDGSTDGSAGILKAHQLTDKRIRVIYQDRHGVSSARNNGLNHAKGEYIFFLDADDIILSNCIINLLNAAQHFNTIPCARIYQFKRKHHENLPEANMPEPSKIQHIHGEDYLKSILVKKRPAYCWGKLFPVSILSNTRFPTELSHGEDLVFNALVLSKEKVRLVDVDNAAYFYRLHESSITADFTINTIHSNIKKITLLRSELDDFKYGAFISFLQISELWTLTKKAITYKEARYSEVNSMINEIYLAYSPLQNIRLSHYIRIIFLSPILLIMRIINRLIMSKIFQIRFLLIHLLTIYYKKGYRIFNLFTSHQ